ncbi:MAG TPA: LytTR family DNA-binding domain-containing protein [Steroidobacteraceae bacterium]|nr:LytTR family DNA-binding domain-containing protein [Steroidobacteraceae bacterium]
MTLRTLIVDDEQLARRGVRAMLERSRDVAVVRECADGPAAVRAIREITPDLVYLDIEMPGMSGFDVVREIGPDSMPHVIFVTAFDQYAVRAFDVSAVDYLLKPLDEQRFALALERACAAVRRRREAKTASGLTELLRGIAAGPPPAPAPARPGFFPVRKGERIILLRIAEVSAVIASGSYVSLQSNGKSWLARETLANVEARFAPCGFVRIHRSTLVNADRVRELRPIDNGEFDVVLDDGQEYHLSRSYRDAVKRIVGREL